MYSLEQWFSTSEINILRWATELFKKLLHLLKNSVSFVSLWLSLHFCVCLVVLTVVTMNDAAVVVDAHFDPQVVQILPGVLGDAGVQGVQGCSVVLRFFWVVLRFFWVVLRFFWGCFDFFGWCFDFFGWCFDFFGWCFDFFSVGLQFFLKFSDFFEIINFDKIFFENIYFDVELM